LETVFMAAAAVVPAEGAGKEAEEEVAVFRGGAGSPFTETCGGGAVVLLPESGFAGTAGFEEAVPGAVVVVVVGAGFVVAGFVVVTVVAIGGADFVASGAVVLSPVSGFEGTPGRRSARISTARAAPV
jgi:hypothetical protein